MNLSKTLQKLTEAFGGKNITITTIEEDKEPKKILGKVMGCWIDAKQEYAHFAFQGPGEPFLTEVSVPVDIKKDTDWCHLSYQFGGDMGDAVRVPEVEGVESFMETFHSCFN